MKVPLRDEKNRRIACAKRPRSTESARGFPPPQNRWTFDHPPARGWCIVRRMPLELFHPLVRDWFLETFEEPSTPQRLGGPEIAAGRAVLIAAPTGTGKTLAAFL